MHGHPKCQVNKMDEKEMNIRFLQAANRKQFILDSDYIFEEIWECDYHEWVKQFPGKPEQKSLLPPFTKTHRGSLTEDNILQAVLMGDLFGMVEIDIEVNP